MRELWQFLWERKLFWLMPLVIALVLLGGLIFLAGAAGPLSPFIYVF